MRQLEHDGLPGARTRIPHTIFEQGLSNPLRALNPTPGWGAGPFLSGSSKPTRKGWLNIAACIEVARHGLGAVFDVELAVQVLQVKLDGVERNGQIARDLLIGTAP